MTSSAYNLIKDINTLKRSIRDVENQMYLVRNNRDYNTLKEKLHNLHLEMKYKASDLASSLTTTIDIDNLIQ